MFLLYKLEMVNKKKCSGFYVLNINKPAQICMYESHDNFLYTVTCNNLSRKLVVAENVSYEDRKHRPLYYKTK
jgi:hypothetical protein